MDELDIKYLSEEGSSVLIFEPSELIGFQDAWDLQRKWQERLLKDPDSQQAIWLLQHPKCYTLGRGGSENNLLFHQDKPPYDLFRIDRGGEVTHHLPGQLVSYLVINLHHYKKDLNWYLRQLENVLIDVINLLGLHGERRPGMTGIWVDDIKVASIGISCKRWITQHGFALNVDCDMSGFDKIIPCGLEGYKVAKLSEWIPGVKMKEVQPLMKKTLIKYFAL